MTDKPTDHAALTSDMANQEQPSCSPALPPFISYKEIPCDILFTELILQVLDTLAEVRIPLLIAGERGLGQGYLAHLIHEAVTHDHAPLLELYLDRNSSPEILSELFRQQPGGSLFKGTLHVHCLENAACPLQNQLLQILEQQQLDLADGRRIVFEGRIAAYIYTPLAAARDVLSPELFYKFSIAPLLLTPIRERLSDIPLLADIFMQQGVKRLGLSAKQLLPDALQRLQEYRWPGNIPELECSVYRSILFAKDNVLAAQDILFENSMQNVQAEKPADKNELGQIIALKKEPAISAAEKTAVSPPLSVGHLVGELSHEIKNPLVAIKTFIQLLPGHINDPEFLSEFFSVAARSIDRVDYLAERLYEFATFAAPSAASLSLPAVLAELLKHEEAHLQKLTIDIDARIPENLPDVHADREHLRYCLQNILLHIAHTAESDRQVRINLYQENASVVMSIAYAGKKQVQGVAFANSRGEGIRDLKGLDLFLAEQLLEKNDVQFSAGGDSYYAYITLQFQVQ